MKLVINTQNHSMKLECSKGQIRRANTLLLEIDKLQYDLTAWYELCNKSIWFPSIKPYDISWGNGGRELIIEDNPAHVWAWADAKRNHLIVSNYDTPHGEGLL